MTVKLAKVTIQKELLKFKISFKFNYDKIKLAKFTQNTLLKKKCIYLDCRVKKKWLKIFNVFFFSFSTMSISNENVPQWFWFLVVNAFTFLSFHFSCLIKDIARECEMHNSKYLYKIIKIKSRFSAQRSKCSRKGCKIFL